MLKFFVLILILSLCSSCSDSLVNVSALDLTNRNSVDFSQEVNGSWEQVCFVQPYTRNIDFEKDFGFKWDLENKTQIHLNDGYVVVLFLKGSKILSYYTVSRSTFDFTQLDQPCFNKRQSAFYVNKNKVSSGKL